MEQLIFGTQVTAGDIRGALALDYENYHDEYHLMYNRCLGYHRKNPFIYTMLKKDDCVVAYINFSPVTEGAYGRLRAGEIDTFLTEEHILPLSDHMSCDIYFSSVVVREDCHGKGYAARLLHSVVGQWADLAAKRDITVRRIVADAISPGGAHLCRLLGLCPVAHTDRDTDTYELSLSPFCGAETPLNRQLLCPRK